MRPEGRAAEASPAARIAGRRMVQGIAVTLGIVFGYRITRLPEDNPDFPPERGLRNDGPRDRCHVYCVTRSPRCSGVYPGRRAAGAGALRVRSLLAAAAEGAPP